VGVPVIQPLPVEASLLGESPFWHPDERALWWCDIPGHRLNRYHPATGEHRARRFDTDVACAAPLTGGHLLLGMRDGLWRFNPASGAGGVTVSNGLAFSPDGRTLYWSDTKAHTVFAFDFDGQDGSLSRQRVWASFPARAADQPLASYGGRPDGAAMDAEGCYWVAMFEGARLLRLSPAGEVLRELPLPVRCPTMPCFGGDDLRTLYITTSRQNRPAEELAREPWAGQVLHCRVEVPGLPVNFAHV